MNFNFKKLPPFKWFVLQNFPFIEADFDAITYYQLLSKIVEYLNKVIDENNAIREQTENLTNAFNELQDYVNHYFDNLDIQEEINNKLDEMAESGQLADIIAQYLQLSGLLCYNSVNDMKNATNLTNGSFAKTFGFYNAYDGGGALYKIRTILNTDEINDISLIALTNDSSLVAELIIENSTVNVKSFGAYGDGLNDDTTNIQLAIDYAKDKYAVFFPTGNYKITDTINIYKNMNIYGVSGGYPWTENEGISQITCELETNKNAFYMVDNSANVYIHNLFFFSNSCRVNHVENQYNPYTLKYVKNTTVENVNCLNLSNAKNGSVIENIGILGFSGTGIIGLTDSTINNIYITHCGVGIDSGIDLIVTNFRIQFCEYGIILANSTRLSQGRIEEISKHGFYITKACYFAICKNVLIDQCGYAGIGIFARLESCDFDIHIHRCCSYYSGMTAVDIFNLSNIVYPATAKIYIDNSGTINNIKIKDFFGLTMKIDDDSNVTVKPLLLYCSNEREIYGHNNIECNLDELVLSNNLSITSLTSSYNYITNNIVKANTNNAYLYIRTERQKELFALWKNNVYYVNNVFIRNTRTYTQNVPLGKIMYCEDNSNWYLTNSNNAFPLTNHIKINS